MNAVYLQLKTIFLSIMICTELPAEGGFAPAKTKVQSQNIC